MNLFYHPRGGPLELLEVVVQGPRHRVVAVARAPVDPALDLLARVVGLAELDARLELALFALVAHFAQRDLAAVQRKLSPPGAATKRLGARRRVQRRWS